MKSYMLTLNGMGADYSEPAWMGKESGPRSHVEMIRLDLLDGFGETFSYGLGSTLDSQTTSNYENLYLDGLITPEQVSG
ncbi:hypothetical protein DY000_02020179 [Brassica cretica]|uniref:Uncharacterized protein n=1 Tax=Brassica cretica TaxID=69181 RepID=A0ABQ7EJN3_BRACR|nr:hypothetical protein DY000_02020179 [Brassica cretica]